MGQLPSRTDGRNSSRTTARNPAAAKGSTSNERLPVFWMMEFATLLLGGELPHLPVARLPSSWDELLDWCEDAEKMAVDMANSFNAPVDETLATSIVPLVHPQHKSQVDGLPSMQPIDQAVFFAISVSKLLRP